MDIVLLLDDQELSVFSGRLHDLLGPLPVASAAILSCLDRRGEGRAVAAMMPAKDPLARTVVDFPWGQEVISCLFV